MTPFIPDSSVYISYINEEDPFHRISRHCIHTLSSQSTEFMLPTLVLLEVGNILQKTLRNFRQEDLFRFFEDHTIINLDFMLAKEVLPLFQKVNLRTSDAIIVAIAKHVNATVITWDKKMLIEAKKLIQIKTPEEFIQ